MPRVAFEPRPLPPGLAASLRERLAAAHEDLPLSAAGSTSQARRSTMSGSISTTTSSLRRSRSSRRGSS